ncbi:hypothetical protein V1477_017858 [Vespula maculifrons]|uniref:Uncharacterized protein n=1 Tax=Vespula maculifrons TaxID=7453 RepID=A0ABD2AZJ5_VESMC
MAVQGAMSPFQLPRSQKCCFPLFPLNHYNSAPIGPIRTKKIWAYRARRALSNDSGQVPLGPIVSEKKIVKENSGSPGCYSFREKIVIKKCFFPLFPLNRYNSAPIGPIWMKEYGRRGRDEPFPTTPDRFSWVL